MEHGLLKVDVDFAAAVDLAAAVGDDASALAGLVVTAGSLASGSGPAAFAFVGAPAGGVAAAGGVAERAHPAAFFGSSHRSESALQRLFA